MTHSRRRRIASILLSTTEAELESQKLKMAKALRVAEQLRAQLTYSESEWSRLHAQMSTLAAQGSFLPLSALTSGQWALREISERSHNLEKQIEEHATSIERLRLEISRSVKRRRKFQEVIETEDERQNAQVISSLQRSLEDTLINRSTA